MEKTKFKKIVINSFWMIMTVLSITYFILVYFYYDNDDPISRKSLHIWFRMMTPRVIPIGDNMELRTPKHWIAPTAREKNDSNKEVLLIGPYSMLFLKWNSNEEVFWRKIDFEERHRTEFFSKETTKFKGHEMWLWKGVYGQEMKIIIYNYFPNQNVIFEFTGENRQESLDAYALITANINLLK